MSKFTMSLVKCFHWLRCTQHISEISSESYGRNMFKYGMLSVSTWLASHIK